MTEEPKEILGSFCAPTYLLFNARNLLVEIHPRERDFQGLSVFKAHDATISPRYWYKTYFQGSYGFPQPREAWCGTV